MTQGTDDRTQEPGRLQPLLLIPVLLAAWAYFPVTGSYFFSDDFVHLQSIVSEGPARFLFTPFAGHNFVLRNLIFLGSWTLFGLRAQPYHWMALGTHVLNVWLLVRVLRSFTGTPMLACLGGVVWGLSSVAAWTLSWYSNYGHALATTMVLVVLGQLGRLVAEDRLPPARTTWVWCGLLLAGTTCFATALGVALLFPLALFLLLPKAWCDPRTRTAFLLLPLAVLAVYFLARWGATLLGPLPPEEVALEGLAVKGLPQIPAFFGHLVAYAVAVLSLGLLLPYEYPSPASWAATAVCAAAFAVFLWRADWPARRAALAMAVLTLGIYFLIAVGRAGLYTAANISPAQGGAMGRHHYLATVPLTILLCLILRELARLPGLRMLPAGLGLCAGLAFVGLPVARIGLPILGFGGAREYIERTAQEIEREVRAQPSGATVYLENGESPKALLGVLPNFMVAGRAAVFLLLHASAVVDGRTVRFIERDREVFARYRNQPHARLAGLLIDPDELARRGR